MDNKHNLKYHKLGNMVEKDDLVLGTWGYFEYLFKNYSCPNHTHQPKLLSWVEVSEICHK